MESLLEELGVPKKYLKPTSREDRFVALVHKSWLKSLQKHTKLIEFVEKPKLEAWPYNDNEVGTAWIKIFIRVLKKKDAKVIPLPRTRGSEKDEPPLSFCELLQYIAQTNYKNLWKEAYKKYSTSLENAKDTQVTLTDYNEVLREIVTRTYGCTIINLCDPSQSTTASKLYDIQLNIIPAICAVETLNAIFLLHIPFFKHNLNDCINFSPMVLDKSVAKPLFIIYQLLHTLQSLHSRSLTLGDVTLNDIYITEDLWIQIFPQLSSNVHIQEFKVENKKSSSIPDCRKLGHKFDANLKCQNCGMKTYDKIQLNGESLEKLCQLWVDGQISNFTYLTALNNLSGRKLGDPNCHHVFPWVTDFTSRCGQNWRDLRKSKYRLNKGDRQLDLTYENSQIAHHVSDVLSPITYYVYMARRTPKSVLCKNVRIIWVPAEYPSSIQRLQEWTPDECIPEFFTDPTVFKSIHDDLDDLEIPPWSCSPEDFVEKHREILESNHVSEKLHYWIDLTFGYKLFGNPAVKAKNVCLQLVDGHTHLTNSGVVQLFSEPHPPKASKSLFWAKSPPKILVQKHKRRDPSTSSMLEASRSEGDEPLDEEGLIQSSNRSPLGLTRFLSRSRSSLNEELKEQKPSRSPSGQRSASLGQKTPTFTSHVAPKSSQLTVQKSSWITKTIYLPKEYNPTWALTNLENMNKFLLKTFHQQEGESQQVKKYITSDSLECDDMVQNAFTNRIFTESFEASLRQPKTKHFNFSMDNVHQSKITKKVENQVTCNYAEIITARRIKEMQILGCLIVEIFMSKRLRALGNNNSKMTFNDRLKACLIIVRNCKDEIPICVKYIIDLLLQPNSDLNNFKYPTVTDFGLPPPTAHLLLEPLINCLIPFSKNFLKLYLLIGSLKDYRNVSEELNIAYHFDCDGKMCQEYENLERTKILFAQNIGECKVKKCALNLEILLDDLNTTTQMEVVYIILPHLKELLEDPPTSVLAAWYIFDPISRVLGPQMAKELLLDSILKLYDVEPNETTIPYNSKIAKLYHHSFLLRLIVRFGLKCFLDNFVTCLVEAVGGYRDYEKVDFVPHTHSEKATRKISNLKSIETEQGEFSPSDDSSVDSEKIATVCEKSIPQDNLPPSEPAIFDFDNEENDQVHSIMEHLELNISNDLPFNNSLTEEAIDAIEDIEETKGREETEIGQPQLSSTGVSSPVIPIPSSFRQEKLSNISCDVGSKKSENEYLYDKQSDPSHFDVEASGSGDSPKSSSKTAQPIKNNEVKISDMGCDSVIWLSHRLGPVLTARYLSRNLLKMLTLCYVGKENMVMITDPSVDVIGIASSLVVGDQNAAKVLDCLATIAALYGEQMILLQYFPHMSELIVLCKRKLTVSLEGGLISCLALLHYIIPYLSDSTLMNHLQDVILKNIINPVIKMVGSTKYIFPHGSIARNIIARKFLDAIYILSLRMGADMSKANLANPTLQRFFLIFDKTNLCSTYVESVDPKPLQEATSPVKSIEKSHFIEVRRDGTTAEWAIGGRPVQISHVRLRDSESADSLSPPPPKQVATSTNDSLKALALEEIQTVFTPELAHIAYTSFLKQIGQAALEGTLSNHTAIQNLCQEYKAGIKAAHPYLSSVMELLDKSKTDDSPTFSTGSLGSNVALIGNRIEVQLDVENRDVYNTDVLNLVRNRMENTTRHLRGNWLAYWEHEIGRAEKDKVFNFKQIKLQTYGGHTNSIKALHILDNENSFMSGSRDKTIKLWSLRSQGDGLSVSNCQWTYTNHKKSILAVTFLESLRLAASCDNSVHIWDPFMGNNIAQLDSPKYPPINVLKSMPAPSSLLFAGNTEGTIRVIDAKICSYIYELKVSLNPTGIIRCMVISPSGNWLAIGQSSGSMTVLDTRTGFVLASWRAHEGEILQLAAPSNETLISTSLDQMISVWNPQDGRLKYHMNIYLPRGATEPVHCLNIYNNELIFGTTANRVGVYTSLENDACISSTKLKPDAFKGLLTSMALLPLNRLLLLGADNGNIYLLC